MPRNLGAPPAVLLEPAQHGVSELRSSRKARAGPCPDPHDRRHEPSGERIVRACHVSRPARCGGRRGWRRRDHRGGRSVRSARCRRGIPGSARRRRRWASGPARRSARAGSQPGTLDDQAAIQARAAAGRWPGQVVARPQPVEHRVAEISVGPVHDDRRAAVTARFTGVEVAVHEGVGQAGTSSSSGNRPSSPRAAAISVPLSSPATGPSSRARICAVRTGARRSVNPTDAGGARWPATAWAAVRRWTALMMTGGEASQQSSPGRCSSRTRPGPAPMTGGTRDGSTRATAAMTLASSAAKRGVALSQTGPVPVGSWNRPDRFQVRRCTGGPGRRPPGRLERARGPAEELANAVQPGPRQPQLLRPGQLLRSAGREASRPGAGRLSAATW